MVFITASRAHTIVLLAFLSFLAQSSLFGVSVSIYNDSPFHLTAEILLADGSNKGKVQLPPLNMTTWHAELGNAVWSQTPFTVIFTCRNGSQYGVFSGVQTGATITALTSQGKRYCQKVKKDKKDNTDKKNKSSDSPEKLRLDPIWGPP
ncbi:hypothetical protein COB21_03410 [Candidatus Aerophobetes bacterium]|uniref:Uncharacterized protein n=1 Tax=Aerophobetes bacterium TaxID=2030807 RepID=A0A2A4X3V8_UNCAE|nr:MAG: hypothetical protein COB21_03410 [Candidatus Aerophobetes bacterium]